MISDEEMDPGFAPSIAASSMAHRRNSRPQRQDEPPISVMIRAGAGPSSSGSESLQSETAQPHRTASSDHNESSDSGFSQNPPMVLLPSITTWFCNLNKVHAGAVLVLCFVNLINYMDRSTVAGMMDYIKADKSFNIGNNNKKLGLLQTAFVICYMLFAPLFGYAGDRWSRKWIMILGLCLWAAATFVGSFMTNFWTFLFFRALVGIGEASYSTIAPAIIADLYTKDSRSRVLAFFYFAIPVGTGLGYVLGSSVAAEASDWRWGLRVTPFMGLVALLLIVFFMIDPERGLSEKSHLRPSSPIVDLIALGKNKSFVLSTVGFTCVTFTAGCLMWWGPEFAYLGAKAACGAKAGCEDITQANVSYKFGIVMTAAGLIGVPLGSYVSQILRHNVPNADPIVCGATLMASVPVLFFGFFMARYSLYACFGLTFLAGLLLNCNWSIVSDMTLYIVIPTRRSMASATQILVSHALGDAASPYLIGAVADWIRPILTPFHPLHEYGWEHTPQYYDIEFRCLQYALFICCFFVVAGAFAFLAMSWYIVEDKAKADLIIAENTEGNEPIVENDELEVQENA